MKNISARSYRLLAELYHQYLLAIDSGTDEGLACFFGNAAHIQQQINSGESVSAIVEHCRELDRHGYLSVLFGDDTIVNASLTDDGILLMEQRFKRGLLDLLDFLGAVRDVLP